MKNEEINELYAISDKKIAKVSLSFKRYLYDQIDWDDRLICLRGAKGVGKTTLMLQLIKESADRRTTLYLSLDSVWLDVKDIYRLVEYHAQHGGTRVVLDEVHYLEKWQQLIKNLYDDFEDLKFAYTGSSMLKIKAKGGDLSRRQAEYDLHGLSFREFLRFDSDLDFPSVDLPTLLKDHVQISERIISKTNILADWNRYLKGGYYPFYKSAKVKYGERIIQAVNQVLESDWTAVEDVSASTVRKARKMLRILAAYPPQTPDMAKLYAELETDRKQGLKILYALERAGLIVLLAREKEKLDNLSSPEKIFCDNPNLMYAICPQANIGTIREAFVLNQLKVGHATTYPKRGDVLIDGKWLVEIGGKGKGFDQIADLPDSFVLNDDTEIGRNHKLPLWLFGFLN